MQVYCGGVIYFGINCAAASLSAFLPTIIQTFGFSMCLIASTTVEKLWIEIFLCFVANAIAQLLTVPPYAVAAFCLVLLSYIADRMQSRGMFMAGASLVGAAGYL